MTLKMLRQTLLCLCLVAAPAGAQRKTVNLNSDWTFRFSHQVDKNSRRRVDLPHTWNTTDALAGHCDYKRGIGNYTKRLHVPENWHGKRLFVRFDGANSVADLFVNGCHVGSHRGGYSAFVFEITDRVRYGVDNQLLVRVNNAEQLDVMPLVGDFNFYGGIYRDVQLLVTERVCISPLDYASPGVYLHQRRVTADEASVEAEVLVSGTGSGEQALTARIEVCDGQRTVATGSREVSATGEGSTQRVMLPVTIAKPHLWDGTADPFMYRAKVSLWQAGKLVDEVEQPLGLRFFRVDPERGFFLNGRHLPLHGVCRHQDRPEIGNALSNTHHREDVAIIREMGANAIRLSHYPHAPEMYRLLDEAGIVAWSEIPFVGPGGYADKGFVDSEAFRDNGRQQLREMIRQQYNHPCICFWGLFNELKTEGDNPVPYLRELNDMAHQEDASRITTCASNQDGDINWVTDIGAWNRYDGWYGASPASLAAFLDRTHEQHPNRCIGISEYGAGASIYHQQDSLSQPVPNSWWHPENWQTYYHIQNWDIIAARPYVWGTFVWNMFDFGAAHRTEGDRPGVNDKGLVTFDRKTRKDAFYFYKANWNPEPMLHIAGKRCVATTREELELMVFTNCASVRLWLNGQEVGNVRTGQHGIARKTLRLQSGANTIKVTAKGQGRTLADTYEIIYHKNNE